MKNDNNAFDLTVICQLFYPELVSTGQTLTELIEELSNKGLKIKVVASQPTILKNSEKTDKVIGYKGITIIRTWSTRFPKISFWGKLLNLTTFFFSASVYILTRKHKTPLLLLTNPPYLPMLGWLYSILFRKPYGVLLFDIMPEQAELVSIIRKDGFISKLWKKINNIWYKKAKYIIVLSKDMLEGAVSNAMLSGKSYEQECRDKTSIIHIWSDDRLITPFAKKDSKEAKRLNVEDKFVIQYSGNHGRFHDIDTLIGISENFKDYDKIVFQFIGEGYKKRIAEEMKNKIGGNLIYTSGYVDKNLLPDSLAMADLGVVAQLPGQERVCYPSKLLGVMASGRAILAICPKGCDMAKMVLENNLGFVVDNKDIEGGTEIIKEALHNRELLTGMGNNSYNYLKNNLTLANASDKYYELITKNLY